MGIRALSSTYVYRPHFSYVSINMNTIPANGIYSVTVGCSRFLQNPGIEITSVIEDKEDRGYEAILRS